MSLASNLQLFAERVAGEFRTVRTLVTGTATGTLSGLSTSNKTSIVAAINEIQSGANIPAASETVQGKVELATAAETTTGTDNTRAVHPAGLKVELDKKVNTSALAQVATTGNAAHLTGTLSTAQLPPLAINEVFTATSQAAMLALNAQRGDMAVRSDLGTMYVLSTDVPGTLANWVELTATGKVISVAGRTGAVTLTKADVGLSNVDNTSDANKPVSTATQTALNGKANTVHGHALTDANITGILPLAQTHADVFNATNHLPAISEVTGLTAALAAKSDTTHTHDDRYYTKTEIGNPEADLVAAFNTALAVT